MTIRQSRGRAGRVAGSVVALFLTGVTAVVDLSPDWVRFGPGRGLRNRVLRRELPTVVATPHPVAKVEQSARDDLPRQTDHTVVLATRTLGTGGVEAVVSTLARNLPAWGADVIVACDRGGSTADELRSAGARVVEGLSAHAFEKLLAGLPPRSVVQLHNAAPDEILGSCARTTTPFINVVHTTDVNLRADDWAREYERAAAASATVAVSATVADYYVGHLPHPMTAEPVVIPNGFTESPPSPHEISEARARLGDALDVSLDSTVLFVCLARYDMQKNIPGLVSAFLAAARERTDIRLVVAGPVEDWLEPALADAIRKSHPSGDRVHLMGSSSARILFAAADAFVLDSFFEGWPVAATEAAAVGLPVVASEVGGIVELVGDPPTRGVVVANAAGDPRESDLPAIRRARRRPQRQSNRAELAEAIVQVRDRIDVWRGDRARLRSDAREQLSTEAMVSAHASVIAQVVGAGDSHV